MDEWHAWVRGETCTGVWWDKLTLRYHLEEPGLNEGTILKWSLGCRMGGCELDGCGSEQRQLASCCVHG